MNVILISGGLVEGPAYPEPMEEPAMAEEVLFPRWYYAASTPEGRVFDDQAALDAASAEGPWFTTPTAAADAAATAATAPPVAEADEQEHSARRSHR